MPAYNYFRNFNQRRLIPVGFGYIYRNESKTLAPKYFMGILLLWFSRALSTCALLSEETGQLINSGKRYDANTSSSNEILRVVREASSSGRPPLILKESRGVPGMIWYDRCKSRVLSNVKK